MMTSPGFWPAAQGPEPFRLDGHVRLAARRHARHRRAALPRRGDLHRIGAVETAGDDRMRGGGRLAELADRVDGDGAAGRLHVLLRAGLLVGAAEIGVHQFVGGGIDALLHHLRRQIAALEDHLEFPQAGLARRHVERQRGRGGKNGGGDDGKMTTHGMPSIADHMRMIARRLRWQNHIGVRRQTAASHRDQVAGLAPLDIHARRADGRAPARPRRSCRSATGCG